MIFKLTAEILIGCEKVVKDHSLHSSQVNDANRKFTHPRPDGWKPRRDLSRHNPNRKESKDMLNNLMNRRALKLALLMVTILVVPAIVSVPAAAKDKALSKTQLNHLIATAETKADHERIAQYFDAEATKYETEAKEHAELAQAYRKSGAASAKYPGSMQTFNHCDSLSTSLEQAAENARQLAADHRQMAKEGK